MSLRLLTITFAVALALFSCFSASALPPLGLTQIDIEEDPSARLAVFDGTAYVSTDAGIYPIDELGVQSVLVPSPSGFGAIAGTTRVVKSVSGDLIVAATFDRQPGVAGGAVALALNDLQSPILAWSFFGSVSAIDSRLRAVGIDLDGYVLNENGSVEFFGANSNFFRPYDLTPNGVAYGTGAIPNTIGAAPALLDLDGGFEFLAGFGGPNSIRERSDIEGINVAYSAEYLTVEYADSRIFNIDESQNRFPLGNEFIHVSESDFVVVQTRSFPQSASLADILAYYPGINPAGIDRSVPLGDLFPELSTIDFDYITDISSSEGQIHLLLSGDDGLWLFAARDPSVVPEPSTVCIGAVLLIGFAALRKRRG